MTFNYAKTKLYRLGVILAKLFSLNSSACLEQTYNPVPRIKFLQSIFYKLIEFYQNKYHTPKPQIYPLKELKL